MDEETKQWINQIDKRMVNIEKCQSEMTKQLNNHLDHIKNDITVCRTDIEWIKKMVNGGSNNENKNYIRTQTDVDWIKRFFWILISATVTSIFSLIILFIKLILPLK